MNKPIKVDPQVIGVLKELKENPDIEKEEDLTLGDINYTQLRYSPIDINNPQTSSPTAYSSSAYSPLQQQQQKYKQKILQQQYLRNDLLRQHLLNQQQSINNQFPPGYINETQTRNIGSLVGAIGGLIGNAFRDFIVTKKKNKDGTK